MKKYIIKRLLISVSTLFIILLVLFILLHSMPGSPFNDERLDDEQRAVLYQVYGLNRPIAEQLIIYMKNMLTGDFGVSYNISRNTPISILLKTRVPVSLKIGGLSILIGTSTGLILGIASALKKNTIWDNVFTIVSVLGVSLPSYVLALIFSYSFGFRLKLFPVRYDSALPFRSIVLPAVALSMFSMATIARFTRTEMIEVMNSEYVEFAKSRGITDGRLLVKYILRNSLVGIITVIAPLIVGLLTGSLVIEQIFSIPGVGSLMVEAIQGNDFNVIIALSFIFSMIYILFMLVVDILYGLIDPRISLDSKVGG